MAKVTAIITLDAEDVDWVRGKLAAIRSEAQMDAQFLDIRANDQRVGEIAQSQWQADADAMTRRQDALSGMIGALWHAAQGEHDQLRETVERVKAARDRAKIRHDEMEKTFSDAIDYAAALRERIYNGDVQTAADALDCMREDAKRRYCELNGMLDAMGI